jgi:hypothetical protein
MDDPGYAGAVAALAHLKSGVGAAEAHGVLCGLLCARPDGPVEDWLEEIVDPPPPGDLLAESGHRLLRVLGGSTRRQLLSGDFAFGLLLPADDQPLPVRAAALRDWSAGFLYGLGRFAALDTRRLSEDGRELVGDLAEVTRLDCARIGGERDEEAYAELVEYVRMGVLLLQEDLRALPAARG